MALTEEINPRARIGGNNPPEPITREGELERLRGEYSHLEQEVKTLLDDARKLPKEFDADSEHFAETARLATAIRTKAKALDDTRTELKEPILIAGRAIDETFFGFIDRLIRRDKKSPAGAAEILEARLTTAQTKKAAEEQARLRAEAEAAALKLEQDRKAAAAAEAVAAAAAAAAARARNPERIEEKQQIAAELSEKAQAASVGVAVSEEAAHRTYVESLQTPKQLTETKIEGGPKASLGEETYAEVIDRNKLDKAALWPFFKDEEIAKALNAWAKTGSYNKPMEGAAIGRRPKTKLRR